jgi:hypothetical protein
MARSFSDRLEPAKCVEGISVLVGMVDDLASLILAVEEAQEVLAQGFSAAWCNPSETPLRILVPCTPAGIDELFRKITKGADLASLAPILEKFGTRIIGPALFDNISYDSLAVLVSAADWSWRRWLT